MPAGIILVHGYTGASTDLAPLFEKLSDHYGVRRVINVSLPYHDTNEIPEFDPIAFVKEISRAVTIFRKKNQKIIFIGHSTGGVFILSYLLKHAIVPALLILAGVPNKITIDDLETWKSHSSGKLQPTLTSIARMVSLINSVGRKKFKENFPVLILTGEKDDLVPKTQAYNWKKNFKGQKRIVIVPESDHHFCNEKIMSNFFCDLIVRAVSDVYNRVDTQADKALIRLAQIEPEATLFLANSPMSSYHLSGCPGTKRMIRAIPKYPETAATEPVFANIEITTHCNLSCRYCARTQFGIKGQHMSCSMFSKILDLLPHAYRITLVGLGEPLLHPQVTDIIKIAATAGRRVALVTNAQNLDPSMSRRLIDAGLDSIAFSIDSPDQKLSEQLRAGTDLDKIIRNIKAFTRLADETGLISKAVFSAVSSNSLPYLESLIDLVASLGVNVLMLSDLNFKKNLANSLWQNMDNTTAADLKRIIGGSFSKKLPVLSVRGLEEFGLRQRYMEFLAVPPSKIYKRSQTHCFCLSPWQTLPVNVKGDILLCDCQPEKKIGNLFSDPFTSIWNGRIMKAYRRQMTGPAPPESCKICPRF